MENRAHVVVYLCVIVEMCNRGVIEILLSDTNFISVVGVFGYNPGLIREMDFRTALEGGGGFNEVHVCSNRMDWTKC